MKLALTKYGRREWILASVLIAAGMVASLYFARPHWAWSVATIAPLAVLWGWVLWFFRDPDRRPPDGPDLLVSPADGRVTDITPVGPESPLGVDGVRVGIFMSVFDVHVNRSAADAVVQKIEHRMGAFLDARDPSASERNESATIYLSLRRGALSYPVVMRQVAGLIARRIVTDLKPGQALARGQRIGMIKFGSRMELLVPAALAPRVLVEIGRHVRAGMTPLIALGHGE